MQIGWKDNFQAFTSAFKNLEANDLSQIGISLKRAFDLLNQFRLQSNVDNYGQGRYPFYIEPATIILLTDGGQFTSLSSVTEKVWRDVVILDYQPLYLHLFTAHFAQPTNFYHIAYYRTI